MKVFVCDCETTGLPRKRTACPSEIHLYDTSRLLEFAYIIYDTTTNTKISEYTNLIKPDNFEVRATHVHGITTKMAETGIPINQLFDDLELVIDQFECIVAHNINFDMRIILSEMYRYKRFKLHDMFLSKKLLCTMLTGAKAFTNKSTISLVDLTENLGLPPFIGHHSLVDSQAALDCLIAMKEKKIKFENWKHNISKIELDDIISYHLKINNEYVHFEK